MSSTPLFDQIARRAEAQAAPAAPVAPTAPTAQAAPAAPAAPVAQAMRASTIDSPAQPSSAAAPASPIGATPVRAAVPAALISEINDIPALVTAELRRESALAPEQLALVEELGDTLIRVVVDALATELDRIVRDRAVRG